MTNKTLLFLALGVLAMTGVMGHMALRTSALWQLPHREILGRVYDNVYKVECYEFGDHSILRRVCRWLGR
jgi:hypothetical protein